VEGFATSVISALARYFCRPRGVQFDSLSYIEYYEQFNIGRRCSSRTAEVFHDNPPTAAVPSFAVWRRTARVVARIHRCNPRDGERYFARKLLLHFPARSYAELRTVRERLYSTCREACEASGLIRAGEEYHDAMREGVRLQSTPAELRSLFLLCIADGGPARPLLAIFGVAMLLDVFPSLLPGQDLFQCSDTTFLHALLRLLRSPLLMEGRTLSNFDLAEPPASDSHISEREQHLRDFPVEASEARYLATRGQLNSQQLQALDAVLAAVDARRGLSLFVDGPSGTGKSFGLRAIALAIRARGLICLPCAFTGIAAGDHEGGVTAHKLFKLPLNVSVDDPSEAPSLLAVNSERADLLRSATVIILDEMPMLHKKYVAIIDRLLRELMHNEQPFGGKVFIRAGDFRQIAPVIPSGTKSDILAASVKSSPLWDHFRVIHFLRPMRDGGDLAWSWFVRQVGNGTRGLESVSSLKPQDGPHNVAADPRLRFFSCPDPSDSEPILQAREWIFPDSVLCNPDEAITKTIVCPLCALIMPQFLRGCLESHRRYLPPKKWKVIILRAMSLSLAPNI